MSRALLVVLPVALIASATIAIAAENSATPLPPPSRAGRVSAIDGRMSLHVPGDETWIDAEKNFPVTANMEFKTESDTHGELQLGDIVVAIGGNTSVAVESLDDKTTFLFVQGGTIDVHVNDLSSDDQITIETPDSSALVKEIGSYRVDVSDHINTQVAVFDGRAEIETSDGYQTLTSGHALALDDDRHVQKLNPATTSLEDWAAERDNRLEASASARYVSTDIPGYEELDAAGTWQATKDYGEVWVPSKVPGNWAPYQQGHWAWVLPWGWTWVDTAAWGFAPSHYGRWVFADGRWAWSPGKRLRHSVYVPAVVGFDGVDPARFASQRQTPRHWVALGPGEIYRAPYTRDMEYLRKVNRGSVPSDTLAAATWESDEWPTFMNVDYVHFDQVSAPQKLTAEDRPADKKEDKTADKEDKTADKTADADKALDDQGQMILHIPLIEARRLNLVPPDGNTPASDDNHPSQPDQNHRIAVSDGNAIDHDKAKAGDPLVHPELEDRSGLVDPLPTRKESSDAVTRERIEVAHETPLSRPVHTQPKLKEQVNMTGPDKTDHGSSPSKIESESN